MFMQTERKLDKSLTSLFNFDDNTPAILERLVKEIYDNKELCTYQFLNHPGCEDMLCGILKLVGSEDTRIAGNASYVVGSLAEISLGCSKIIGICTSSLVEDNVLLNFTSLLDVSDAETVLHAAGTLGTLAENDEGRLWLLRQEYLDATINKIALLLSFENKWTAINAALVLARLTMSEEGCARILNHPQLMKIITDLIKSLCCDNGGVGMNAAFAIGRLCDLQAGRVKLLQHHESTLLVDSLLQMLQSDDAGCSKSACFAVTCIAANSLGHSRVLNNKYSNHLFPSLRTMLSSADEESVWFAAMNVRTIASQKEGVLALREDDQLLRALTELSKKPGINEDAMNEVNYALELLEKLPKPNSPNVRVESAYVISARWDKIFPKSGLDVVYELYREDEMVYRGEEDSFMMNDVKAVTKYSFRLKVTTEGDASSYSDVEVVTTPESVPGAPQSLFCLNRTTSQIKISWDPPELKNGVLNCYQVTVQGPKVSLPPYQDTCDNYYILSGLLPDTRYTFEVYAVTGRGRGVPAVLNIQTVDLGHHAPPKPTLSVLGRHEIQVEWDTPKEPLNRINGYDVKVNGEIAYNGLERYCIIRYLQPDTEYTVTVSAWTNEGRCESVPSKRRTNRDITIPCHRRPPLYPYDKIAANKEREEMRGKTMTSLKSSTKDKRNWKPERSISRPKVTIQSDHEHMAKKELASGPSRSIFQFKRKDVDKWESDQSP